MFGVSSVLPTIRPLAVNERIALYATVDDHFRFVGRPERSGLIPRILLLVPKNMLPGKEPGHRPAPAFLQGA